MKPLLTALGAAATLAAMSAAAQTAAPADPDLQPRVQTSSVLPAMSAGTLHEESGAVHPAAPAVSPDVPAAAAADATAGAKAAVSADAVAPAAARPARTGERSGRPAAAAASTDQLQLGTTEISGNRELPKLMYIVPWRTAQIGAFAGRPPNSLVDEALTPIDRAVFERQNRYYAALESGASAPAAAAAGAGRPAAGGAGVAGSAGIDPTSRNGGGDEK